MRVLLALLFVTTLAVAGHAQGIRVEAVRSSNGIVKGAPYSAEAVTETNQVLADGNKITRRSVTRLYRDSEGRTRREDHHAQLGVAGAVVDMPESISITDPIAGVRYQLDPKKNTARQSTFRVSFNMPGIKTKMPEMPRIIEPKLVLKMETGEKELFSDARKAEMAARTAERQKEAEARRAEMEKRREEMEKNRQEMEKHEAFKPSSGSSDINTRTESLGTQNIEGVSADGTRTTTIIPAGSIGNERDIEVVYEKWYSKELQMTVFSKRSDPRTGENIYRVTNINRSDPPINLFTPPADYTLIDTSQPKPKTPPIPKVSTTIRKVAPVSAIRKVGVEH